jgi:hypothetical protein
MDPVAADEPPPPPLDWDHPAPGDVTYYLEARPHFPALNGEMCPSGCLPAAEVARHLREAADHIERYWAADKVERRP